MSQVRWKYRIGPGRAANLAGGGGEGAAAAAAPVTADAPSRSCPTAQPLAACACASRLLNLKQPESSFETTAKPRGYVRAGGGREYIPTLSFGLSHSLISGQQLWHPPDSAFIQTFPISLPKAAQQQL